MSKLKKNIYYSALLILSQLLIPLITFPYVSHILGPEKLGLVNFIDSICQNCILIAALGVPVYGIREVAKAKNDPDKLNKVVIELLIIHIVSTLIILVPYTLLFVFNPTLHANGQLFWISVLSILSQVFLIEWFYQGIEEFKFITSRSLIVRFVLLAALFIFVKQESDYIVYYAILTATFVLNALWNITRVFTRIKFDFTTLKLRRHLKPLFYILSSSLAISVYSYLDSTMLGFLTLPIYVGYYSSSLKLIRISLTMVMATEKVLVPQLASAFHNNDWELVNKLVNKSISFVCLIGCPAVCLLVVLSPQIISVLMGARFLPAIISTRILASTVLIIGLNSIFGLQILTTMGKENYFMRSVIAGMFFSVITNLILIPRFEHVGTSITNLLTELLVLFLSYRYAIKHTDVKIKLSPILKYLLVAILAILSAYLILNLIKINNNILTIAFTSIFGGFLYFLTLYFLKEEITRNFITSLATSKYLKFIQSK